MDEEDIHPTDENLAKSLKEFIEKGIDQVYIYYSLNKFI